MQSTARPLMLIAMLGVACAVPVAHATPYVFTTINPTGASGTPSGTFVSDVFGINNNGQVVVGTNGGAFVYQGGVYTPLPAGPAGYTLGPEGINDAGTIVGTATDASGNSEGFILQGGSYSLFNVPGNTGYMEARAVSPTNVVSGIFTDAAGNQEGYTYDPGTGAFTDINPSGSIVTFAQGMNKAGQLAGSAIDPYAGVSGRYGFVYQGGSYATFVIPGAVETAARAINDSGAVAGWADFSSGSAGGANTYTFVQQPSGAYQLLADPAAGTATGSQFAGTFAEAMNDSGQIAGDYMDVSGNMFGFIATPVVLPAGSTASGAFSFDVPVTGGSLIYIDPTMATGYQYQIGGGDPNFQSVVLPIGIGDNMYSLSLCDGTSLGELAGGTAYDFGAGGTGCFDVSGIPGSAGLDPTDSQAFATGLTFAGAGTFTGTMTPLTSTVAGVPEPGALELFAAGLLGLTLMTRILPASRRR